MRGQGQVSKLVAGGVAFVALTVGIFWYQFHRIQTGDAYPTWNRLRWGYLTLILLLLPVETLAAGLRIWLVSRVLQPGLRLWTCIKAEWANAAISMLTPSQSGGGAGQIYILNRDGASVGTALTISLLSFVGTMVSLFLMGLYTLLLSGMEQTGRLFLLAVWSLVLLSGAMALAALRPCLFRFVLGWASRVLWRLAGARHPLRDWWPPDQPRTGPPVDRMDPWTGKLVDIVYTYRRDTVRFLRLGKSTFPWVCLLSLVFLLSRSLMPFLCIRFLGIEASTLRQVVETQMVLIFLVFFAPTPGAAGVAEGASLSIMGEIVPVGFAPHYNLLWRFSTLYLAALAGLFCLLRALLEDAGAIIHRSR
jgi:hypothetical protein